MSSAQTILITGAGGLLGRHAVVSFAATHSIHAIVRRAPEEGAQVPNVTYHCCDFAGNWDVTNLPEKVDVVVHLAQSDKFRDFPNGAMDVFDVNIGSTARLLDYAHRAGAKQFIYASSGGVYATGAEALGEDAPIKPPKDLGYYLSSKLCSEILVQNYAAHMRVNILRIFFMYGRGQKRSMLLPRLYDNVREGRPITLQGEEGLRINPLHVGDAVASIAAAFATDESMVCNIAGPKAYSLKEIALLMGKELGKEPVFSQAEGEPQDLVATTDTMARLRAPSRTLEDSLSDIA